MNTSYGFSKIAGLLLCVVVVSIVFLAMKGSSEMSPTDESSPETSPIDTVQSSDDVVPLSEFKDIQCQNMSATLHVPVSFVSYEEVNAKGEYVCLFSDKIQEGHVSRTRMHITVFATKNSKSMLGISSRQAAQMDTQKYGGITDLPDSVAKKGDFVTYHVIAPDAFENTAIWYIDSIANEATDTFYTVTLSVPKTAEGTIDPRVIMDGYTLSSTF